MQSLLRRGGVESVVVAWEIDNIRVLLCRSVGMEALRALVDREDNARDGVEPLSVARE